jgi:O-antigen/teichoic acid export membrane protein
VTAPPRVPSKIETANSLKARLARGAAGAFVINIVGTGLAFLSQLVLARALGVEGYGVYAYVITWVTALGLVATLGFRTAVLRFASSYRAQEEWNLLRGIVGYADRWVLFSGVCVAFMIAGTILALGGRLSAELTRTFIVGGAVVPFLALLDVRSYLLRVFDRVGWALAPMLIVRPTSTLLLVGVLLVSGPYAVPPSWAMAATLLSTVIALLLVSLVLRRSRPPGLAHAPVAERPEEWRRAALPLFVMVVIQALLSRSDVIMIGGLAGTTDAGIYAVSARIAGLVGFALIAMNTIFAPTIAALHARGEHVALQSLVTIAARWTALSALLIGLPLFVLAEWVLGMFGDAFAVGATALRILLVGHLVSATIGSVAYIMVMTGHERQSAIVDGAAAVAQIALYALVIPSFGLEGAAVVASARTACWSLVLAFLVWKNLKIVPSVFAR